MPRDWEAAGKRAEERGRQMQKAGGKLFFALTLPIVGAVVFGWVGLAIGLIVGVVALKATA